VEAWLSISTKLDAPAGNAGVSTASVKTTTMKTRWPRALRVEQTRSTSPTSANCDRLDAMWNPDQGGGALSYAKQLARRTRLYSSYQGRSRRCTGSSLR
jgi:hypothetical protein